MGIAIQKDIDHQTRPCLLINEWRCIPSQSLFIEKRKNKIKIIHPSKTCQNKPQKNLPIPMMDTFKTRHHRLDIHSYIHHRSTKKLGIINSPLLSFGQHGFCQIKASNHFSTLLPNKVKSRSTMVKERSLTNPKCQALLPMTTIALNRAFGVLFTYL